MVLTSYHNITSPLTSSQTTIGSGLMSQHGIEKTQNRWKQQVQRRHIQTGNGTPLPLTSWQFYRCHAPNNTTTDQLLSQLSSCASSTIPQEDQIFKSIHLFQWRCRLWTKQKGEKRAKQDALFFSEGHTRSLRVCSPNLFCVSQMLARKISTSLSITANISALIWEVLPHSSSLCFTKANS